MWDGVDGVDESIPDEEGRMDIPNKLLAENPQRQDPLSISIELCTKDMNRSS